MPEGAVLYEGGLPLGRRDAHDPDLAVDVTARGGVVYLNLSVQGNAAFAQLVGDLSPAEAFELAYALREGGRAAVGLPGFGAFDLDGAVCG